MPVTDALYREIALADPEGKWELVGGRLRSKPTMCSPHNSRSYRLSFLLASQLDWNEYEVRQDQS